MATGKTFWDYGDEEGRLAGKDAASHASKEKKAEEDSEESETDRELREAERFWLKPTPAKFVILALGAIGFTVAGGQEGATVCAFLAVFLLVPKKRRQPTSRRPSSGARPASRRGASRASRTRRPRR